MGEKMEENNIEIEKQIYTMFLRSYVEEYIKKFGFDKNLSEFAKQINKIKREGKKQ